MNKHPAPVAARRVHSTTLGKGEFQQKNKINSESASKQASPKPSKQLKNRLQKSLSTDNSGNDHSGQSETLHAKALQEERTIQSNENKIHLKKRSMQLHLLQKFQNSGAHYSKDYSLRENLASSSSKVGASVDTLSSAASSKRVASTYLKIDSSSVKRYLESHIA